MRRPRRPSLTVAVTTRDAETHLGPTLAEASHYADEILVAVDLGSADGTWDVAASGADRVFGFRHTTGAGQARMACLERARGDWILFLDDDEGMDAAFPDLRDELLGAPGIKHWWLPRRCLTALRPPVHLCDETWWPDWSLRLTVADTTRVYKPRDLHSGLRAMGPGGREPRTAILHYERIVRSDAARAAKQAHYRERGQLPVTDRYFAPAPGVATAPVLPPPLRGTAAAHGRCSGAAVETHVEDLELRPSAPGWAATVTVEMPATARPGELLFATGVARNTGTLRWVAPAATDVWPVLGLAYRVQCADGTLLPDAAERAHVGRDVAPGETAHFLARAQAPAEPGNYVLLWGLVSEFEAWFSDLGSEPARCPLTVAP